MRIIKFTFDTPILLVSSEILKTIGTYIIREYNIFYRDIVFTYNNSKGTIIIYNVPDDKYDDILSILINIHGDDIYIE